MKRIIESRGLGKTTKLIELAYAENAILVVCNEQNKKYVNQLAKAIEKPVTIMTITDIIMNRNNYAIHNDTRIIIDELELCMNTIIPGFLDGYSISIDDGF